MSIRIGILGYGNLGRGIECAIKQNNDLELVAVFTRRKPETVKILTPNVPVYSVEGGKVLVTVGEAEHPMAEEHYIEWISLQTKAGNQRKALKPGDAPKVCFAICEGDEVEAVYAYCNLHGLWQAV